jgi:signal recognition particle receptor subunit beta
MTSTYKVVLVGAAEVGKTMWVRRLHSRKSFRWVENTKYTPTIGVEVVPLRYDGFNLNIWDCAGQESLQVLKEAYYIGADAAIVMNNGRNFEIARGYIDLLQRVNPRIPIIHITSIIGSVPLNESQINVKKGDNLDTPLDLVLRAIKIKEENEAGALVNFTEEKAKL